MMQMDDNTIDRVTKLEMLLCKEIEEKKKGSLVARKD